MNEPAFEDIATKVRVITAPPVVVPVFEQRIIWGNLSLMIEWLRERRPECLPDEWNGAPETLFPHDLTEAGRRLTDNELIPELCGRECYHSFGLKAGRKSNREYIEHTQEGAIPHASIMYHAKMSFFIAGVSRRVSHELIRNYVGADRDEEGSPSQESTRFTHHYGCYIAHPHILGDEKELARFTHAMNWNYAEYTAYIEESTRTFTDRVGASPKGMDRKRIYEAASSYLSHSCETSWIWTTNPIAISKMLRERGDAGADKEWQRLARVWARVCTQRWPNLFRQPWVLSLADLPLVVG